MVPFVHNNPVDNVYHQSNSCDADCHDDLDIGCDIKAIDKAQIHTKEVHECHQNFWLELDANFAVKGVVFVEVALFCPENNEQPDPDVENHVGHKESIKLNDPPYSE